MTPLFGEGENRVQVGFSQTAFPNVAIQDVQAALAICDDITRKVKGIDHFSTAIYPSVDALAEAMRKGRLDLAVLPMLEYLRSESILDGEPGLVPTAGLGAMQRYHLVVRANLPNPQLQTLRNLRFCHVKHEPVGLLFLNHTLLHKGLPEMDGFFTRVETVPRGSQALSSVYFGRTDACLVTEEAYQTSLAMNPQVGHKVRILLTSPPMLGGLGVFHKGYPAPMRQLVCEAGNDLKNHPRGAQILGLFGAMEMRRATDADLAEVRRLYREYRQKKGRFL
jgi:phosphonate transport system substrate-binding protein